MLLRFFGGNGKIYNLELTAGVSAQPRWVTLAALMIAADQPPTLEGNLRVASQRIDAAAAEGADLVLLPETYNTRGVEGLGPTEGAASLEEEAVQLLRRKALEHQIYTAASVRLREENGLVSNTLVLFDPRGQLVGRYTKAHLTMGEIWSGMVPGQEIPVFPTEVGRIGCSICWDRFMPEHARVLFLQGADIVLNPTASAEYPWIRLTMATPTAHLSLPHRQQLMPALPGLPVETARFWPLRTRKRVMPWPGWI